MTTLRVLVTGSRDITDYRPISDALIDVYQERIVRATHTSSMVVVHGDCPTGADRLARGEVRWARSIGAHVTDEPHPADWAAHGPTAGPIRNQQMVDLGADLCLAFFLDGAANKGTADCADRAEAAGIFVRRIHIKAQVTA